MTSGRMERWTTIAGALAAALVAGTAAPSSPAPAATTAARECSAKEYAALRAPATEEAASIQLRCSPRLQKSDLISKRLILSGEKASGITIDCGGATIDGSRGTVNFDKATIHIRSTKAKDGRWSVPRDIAIRGCTIRGAIRIQGLGTNGQGEEVRLSSFSANHTAHAQASAPHGLHLSGMTFVADGKIPLYAAPGVTGMTIENSTFTGHSNGTTIYLDAESARNIIRGNRFAVITKTREQIAVDGSAHNLISGNTFVEPLKGGIYLYRNCGEGGTIRHQKPQYNDITGNTFSYSKGAEGAEPAIWLNSRNGARLYCLTAPSAPFGSGLSSRDFAEFNRISDNILDGGDLSLIRDDDQTNTLEGNRVK